MSRKCVVIRQIKRELKVKKYAPKRAELKKIISNIMISSEVRWAAQQKLQMLPRDSSPVRLRNRCRLTGRPRGVYRHFGLSRNMLRYHAMKGHFPGLVISTW